MKTTPQQPPPPAPPPASSPATAGDQPAAPLPLKTRHRALFEQAREQIQKMFGKSPTPDELMRLWLATATPWEVTSVFETAVLTLAGSDFIPSPGEDYNQTLLGL